MIDFDGMSSTFVAYMKRASAPDYARCWFAWEPIASGAQCTHRGRLEAIRGHGIVQSRSTGFWMRKVGTSSRWSNGAPTEAEGTVHGSMVVLDNKKAIPEAARVRLSVATIAAPEESGQANSKTRPSTCPWIVLKMTNPPSDAVWAVLTSSEFRFNH